MTIATDQSKTKAEVKTEQWMRMYRRMVMIREFEETGGTNFIRGALMPGLAAPLHWRRSSRGGGFARRLRGDDYITSTHRGHGHCVAKGASPDRMFRGAAGQRGGILPVAKADRCTLPILRPATWERMQSWGEVQESPREAALSSKEDLRTGQVAVCFFGEGALGQGVSL